MPSKTARLKAISDRGVDANAAAVRGFERGMEEIASRWRREIIDLVSRPDARSQARLADIAWVSEQVQAALNRQRYGDLLRRFQANYGDAFDRARQALREIDVPPPRLARLDEKAFTALRRMDYSYLEGVGEAAVNEIAQRVTQNAIAGQPRSQAIEAISRVVDAKFRSHAVTYADTALVSYDRRVNIDMWVAAGVRRFLYRGPKDIKNRPFCAPRVGKVFPIEEIDKMLNGVGPEPAKYFGGGWNCRHVWSPAVDGEAVGPPPAPPTAKTPQTAQSYRRLVVPQGVDPQPWLGAIEEAGYGPALEKHPLGKLEFMAHPPEYTKPDGSTAQAWGLYYEGQRRVDVNCMPSIPRYYDNQLVPGISYHISGTSKAVDEVVKRILVHELSHHLYYEVARKAQKAQVSRAFNATVHGITRYARTCETEYFAETMSAYVFERQKLRSYDPIGFMMVEKVRKAFGMEVMP